MNKSYYAIACYKNESNRNVFKEPRYYGAYYDLTKSVIHPKVNRKSYSASKLMRRGPPKFNTSVSRESTTHFQPRNLSVPHPKLLSSTPKTLISTSKTSRFNSKNPSSTHPSVPHQKPFSSTPSLPHLKPLSSTLRTLKFNAPLSSTLKTYQFKTPLRQKIAPYKRCETEGCCTEGFFVWKWWVCGTEGFSVWNWEILALKRCGLWVDPMC